MKSSLQKVQYIMAVESLCQKYDSFSDLDYVYEPKLREALDLAKELVQEQIAISYKWYYDSTTDDVEEGDGIVSHEED